MGMVLGNHDFWFCGKPQCKKKADSFGYGRLQWYAQDTVASAHDDAKLFDFSVGSDSQEIPAIENTFWYTSMGNVAMIGFCNAYPWKKLRPYFSQACEWVAGAAPALVLLIGHWHVAGMGAPGGMGTGDVYQKIQYLSGCNKLGGKLKVIAAHWHFNKIIWKNTGFVFHCIYCCCKERSLYTSPQEGVLMSYIV